MLVFWSVWLARLATAGCVWKTRGWCAPNVDARIPWSMGFRC